jgi:putative ABC transport system permease protein
VLGLSQRRIAWAYMVEFMLVGLVVSVMGVFMGFGVYYLFV